jgi:hypothetical protein
MRKLPTISAFCLIITSFSLRFSGATEYSATSLTTIPWGDGSDELKIDLPFHEDVNNTPQDSTDDWVEFNGPKQGFADAYENIYIASRRYMQLKGFDTTGRLIFDYSEGEPGYNPQLFKTGLRKIYVDSLSRIYVVDGMRYDYVAVADTAGHLLDKLSPYGLGSGVVVYEIESNSDDVLTICCKDRTYHTYEHGIITTGGGSCWRARDGYYYYIRLEDSTHVTFVKYSNPDNYGNSSDLQENRVSLSGPLAYYSEFLGVDDDMNLYVFLVGPRKPDGRVLIFDTAFNLTGEISFPREENRYQWYMRPFMRPSDGNIYEFRCLDDGLHVIRWSKQ